MAAPRRLISMRLLVGLLLSAVVASSAAQPRDATTREGAEAADAQACTDDAECTAMLKRVQAQQLRNEARAEAIYDAKPAWQKLLGWLAIPAVCWLLWQWAGRRPAQPADETRNNETGKK